MQRSNTQEDLELQQSEMGDQTDQIEQNNETSRDKFSAQLSNNNNDTTPVTANHSHNNTILIKCNNQVSIYQDGKNDGDDEEEKIGGPESSDNISSQNNLLQQKLQKISDQEEQDTQQEVTNPKKNSKNNFINLNEFEPILVNNSLNITPLSSLQSSQVYHQQQQGETVQTDEAFSQNKQNPMVQLPKPQIPHKSSRRLSKKAVDVSLSGDVPIKVIKYENIQESKKDTIVYLLEKAILQKPKNQLQIMQKLIDGIHKEFGLSWSVSIINKDCPSFFIKKYEYLMVQAQESTYEIYRQRIETDDYSQDDMKTVIKSKEIDEKTEEILKDMIEDSCTFAKNREERSKVLQENLDEKFGKYWVIAILDKETSLKYNYTHKHIRLRVEFQGLVYEMYKNMEFQAEDIKNEGFKVINKAENITQNMVDNCLKFLQEAFQETNCKFTNLRASILKRKFEQEYGVYWTVIICHRGSAFFNYFDKEHLKIQFRGLQYDIFRSCHMFDAIQVEDLQILQKDKMLEPEIEQYILQIVQKATKLFTKPEQWKDRGTMIREGLENNYGQYWAVIISKTAIKNYSYFKNQFIRIKYKRVIYDIYRSSIFFK